MDSDSFLDFEQAFKKFFSDIGSDLPKLREYIINLIIKNGFTHDGIASVVDNHIKNKLKSLDPQQAIKAMTEMLDVILDTGVRASFSSLTKSNPEDLLLKLEGMTSDFNEALFEEVVNTVSRNLGGEESFALRAAIPETTAFRWEIAYGDQFADFYDVVVDEGIISAGEYLDEGLGLGFNSRRELYDSWLQEATENIRHYIDGTKAVEEIEPFSDYYYWIAIGDNEYSVTQIAEVLKDNFNGRKTFELSDEYKSWLNKLGIQNPTGNVKKDIVAEIVNNVENLSNAVKTKLSGVVNDIPELNLNIFTPGKRYVMPDEGISRLNQAMGETQPESDIIRLENLVDTPTNVVNNIYDDAIEIFDTSELLKNGKLEHIDLADKLMKKGYTFKEVETFLNDVYMKQAKDNPKGFENISKEEFIKYADTPTNVVDDKLSTFDTTLNSADGNVEFYIKHQGTQVSANDIRYNPNLGSDTEKFIPGFYGEPVGNVSAETMGIKIQDNPVSNYYKVQVNTNNLLITQPDGFLGNQIDKVDWDIFAKETGISLSDIKNPKTQNVNSLINELKQLGLDDGTIAKGFRKSGIEGFVELKGDWREVVLIDPNDDLGIGSKLNIQDATEVEFLNNQSKVNQIDELGVTTSSRVIETAEDLQEVIDPKAIGKIEEFAAKFPDKFKQIVRVAGEIPKKALSAAQLLDPGDIVITQGLKTLLPRLGAVAIAGPALTAYVVYELSVLAVDAATALEKAAEKQGLAQFGDNTDVDWKQLGKDTWSEFGDVSDTWSLSWKLSEPMINWAFDKIFSYNEEQ